MTPTTPPEFTHHDLEVAREQASLRTLVEEIHHNTAILPDLALKVERHETQLRAIRWTGGTIISSFFLGVVAWVRSHFAGGGN